LRKTFRRIPGSQSNTTAFFFKATYYGLAIYHNQAKSAQSLNASATAIQNPIL